MKKGRANAKRMCNLRNSSYKRDLKTDSTKIDVNNAIDYTLMSKILEVREGDVL
jgi:hypothetical protein